MATRASTKDYTYYTKGIWIEKKQRAYMAWLNYLLSPTCAINSSSLNSKRLFAKVRGCVANVYHKDAAARAAMMKVESSVSQGRLKLLTNGGFLVNPRMRKKAIKILLGYDPFWLKIGLETVFRMTISPKQKGSNLVANVEEDELQVKSQLTSFLEEQFFSEAELEKKMKKNVKRKAALLEALAAVVLKRFLLLVFLLDRTLTSEGLPEGLPLLFDPSSKTKSSADMIRVVLKGSLFGEGDTVRQLEYMGYVLRYEQGVVNEFDYRVADMTLDLRDGIRSCKLAEVLIGNSLMHRVNFNTTSNAVKVYNVKLGIAAFTALNQDVKVLENRVILPQDIVDGNGETTVGYLWNTALMFQIPQLLTVNALVFEIIQVKVRARSVISSTETSKICFPTGYDIRLALLLTWVQTVVSQYGACAKNYRSSFADGSVLCFLICHYLPSYMHPDEVYIAKVDEELREQISRQATSSSDYEDEYEIDSDDEDLDLKDYGVYSGKGWMHPETFRKHRTGILQNFNAVFAVMRNLGGIPQTISALDFENQGPDETAVMLYVSYMCARLLQVSREERAALTIQRMWKIHKGYADPIELIQLQEEQKRPKPKRKSREQRLSQDSFLSAFERHRQQYSSSRASWESTSEPFDGFDAYYALEPKEMETVVKLQARAKGAIVRRQFIRMKTAVKTLEENQPFIRDRCRYLRQQEKRRQAENVSKAARHRYDQQRDQARRKSAAKVIQCHYRKHSAERDAAATTIQSHWRRHAAEKRYRDMKEAVKAIQSQMEELKKKEHFAKATKAATRIQAAWRGAYERNAFLEKKRAATQIQEAYRMHQAKRAFKTIVAAAIRIQRWIRSWLAKRRYDTAKDAIILIQATYRMHLQRENFLEAQQAAICIQAAVRMHQARESFLTIRNAVLTIQSHWRSHATHEAFLGIQSQVILIQATYRMHLQRENFLELRQAAICIQAAVRMHQARESFLTILNAATTIQRYWKSHAQREAFVQIRSGVVLIQSMVRMHQNRENFLEKKMAAITIQRYYRLHYLHLKGRVVEAAIVIQSAWKRHQQQQKYNAIYQSAVIIQRAVRLHQKRKWLEDVESRLSSILVDFVAAMEHTHDVAKATVIIQAYFRGYLARRQNRQSPSEIKETAKQKLAVKKMVMAYRGYKIRKQEENAQAAKETIKRWLPTIKERCQFLKKRNAASAIQSAWKKHQKRREDAAKVIQKAFRAKKEQRQLNRARAAATKIQSLWRGAQTRARAPIEVKRAVKRLKAAKARAIADPSKTLEFKCKQAVEAVKNNSNVETTFLALASLEMGTMYSQRCCEDIISSDALIPMLKIMARCNRSTEHQAAFRRGLSILSNLCKYKGLTMRVFKAKDFLETLSERLQYYRDCPVIFSGIITIFHAVLKIASNKAELAENALVIRQWNSLWSLLARKVDTERKYINKLEADKASDMSAKRATEKAFQASNQLLELDSLFEALAVAPTDFATYAHSLMSHTQDEKSSKKKKKKKSDVEYTIEDWRFEATAWKPKNTLAKEKLSELRTTGLPIDAGAPPQKSSAYISPMERKKLKQLSNDMDAEAFGRRTGIRLMSNRQKSKLPKSRSGSLGPSKEKKGPNQPRSSVKINRSYSVAPEPRNPRTAKKAAK